MKSAGWLGYQRFAITSFRYNDQIVDSSRFCKFGVGGMRNAWVIYIFLGNNSTQTYYSHVSDSVASTAVLLSMGQKKWSVLLCLEGRGRGSFRKIAKGTMHTIEFKRGGQIPPCHPQMKSLGLWLVPWLVHMSVQGLPLSSFCAVARCS